MSSKILWKQILSALFLAYAVMHLVPFQTTPFETYMQERADKKQEEYRKLLDEAEARVKAWNDPAVPDEAKSKTFYAAVRDIGLGKGSATGVSGGKPFDLTQFFDVRVVDDPNIARRNGFLLQELLRQSQGKLRLGLDLQGGVSFTLRIDPKNFEPKESEIKDAEKRIRQQLTKDIPNPDNAEAVKGLTEAQKKDARAKWDAALAQARERAETVAKENAAAAETRLKEGLERAISVMEGRVNEFGVAEPLIRIVGTDSIEIQLPGEDAANNPDAIEKLKKPAKLEFRMVHRYERPAAGAREHDIKALREDPGNTASAVKLYEVLYMRHEVRRSEAGQGAYANNKAGEVVETPFYIEKQSAAEGNIVKKAYPASQDGFTWQTSINFTSEGGRKFGELTGKIATENNRLMAQGSPHYYGQMAIVLDGKLVSAPGIKPDANGRYHAIDGGSAMIEANSQKDAADLANVLNNPLEFPLELVESKQIGSTLAKDAQYRSALAAAIGISATFLFLILYYLWGGFIASLGLALNTVLMLGIMAVFGATITLPGVAALVLTIGMAIDANILVFERVREEVSAGKPLRSAVQDGYNRAQATIIDANLTSLMAALIMIVLGTGPIKGFGIILSIGIVTTVFTCLVTCRSLQELCINVGIMKAVFGVNLFKKQTNFQFLDAAKPAFIAAIVVTLVAIGNIFHKGADAFSKDFKGGEAAVLRVDQAKPEIPVTDIIKTINDAGVNDVTASYQYALGGDQQRTLRIETELAAHAKPTPGKEPYRATTKRLANYPQAEQAAKALLAKYPDHFPQGVALDDIIESGDSIGGAVSEGLKVNAIASVLLALLGIGVYVALRFEMGMGLGALVSSLHDVLLTAGLFILVGHQFSMSMIAALLMVIGYSINDTIVAFDRIREEMKLHPGKNLRELIHLGLNRTLGRTILTSATTLFSALALWRFGAGDVVEYGLIFVFGILAGTFSTIYIASPIFYWWHGGRRESLEKAEAQVRYDWEAGTQPKKAPALSAGKTEESAKAALGSDKTLARN
ncbi:MAG: protein translocase subunit SecD [Puniceicoccales bacterium]|jgi:SecD/SecF fusion protein|nr:protein translocase subunit SecD [Puniceicoccales bacterium]